MHKTKRSLSFLLAVLMIVGIFAAVPFTASAAAVTPKYKVTINGKSVTNSTTLPYTTSATNLKNKAGYGSYSVTYLKVFKAMDKIGTISGQNFTINKHGSEQLDIGLKKGSSSGHITPKVVCTPITPCVCEVTGYTGTYDGEPHTIEGLTVTSPESGATVKYGTVSGTYNLTEPPTFTDVGTHTVYYQVSASGWVTKTGSVNVVINPKPVTVTAIAQSKIRGTDDPELTYTVDGLLGEDALTGELAREAGEGNGTYAILQGTLDGGSNYAIAYTGANLTIEPNADDIAAADVSAQINAIGTVEYTDACKAKIDDARTAYDALTDTQKTLVTNYTTLTDAETAYANLKAAAEAAAALAQAKTDAKDALAAYKNAADYRPAQQTELTNAINAGNAAIDAATSTDGVATALENAKAAIDAIKTDAELTAEEEAAALVEKAKDWVSVRIDDQICINFLLAQRDDFESVKIEYIDQDLQTAAKTIVYDDLSELTIREGHYLIPVVIAPAQIGDTIKATLTVGGQEIEYTMSVKEYCEYLIANYNGENARAVRELAKATLEYGRAANDYFYGTGFYHQSTITSPYSAEYKEEALHTAKKLTNTLSVTDNLRTKLASAAFMALTKPEFRFYTTGLTEEEAYELNSKITVTGAAGDVTAKFYKNGDQILLEVTGIEAKDMDKVITVTVGDLGTLTFSGYDFARMMAKSDDQSIAALGAALYLYGDAAKACFA